MKFNFFNKKINFSSKKVSLVKVAELLPSGSWDIRYYTEIDGCYISNSSSISKESAESFFNQAIKENGVTKTKEVLKEHIINL